MQLFVKLKRHLKETIKLIKEVAKGLEHLDIISIKGFKKGLYIISIIKKIIVIIADQRLIKIKVFINIKEIKALIDLRAMSNFIIKEQVRKIRILFKIKARPYKLRTIDKIKIKSRKVDIKTKEIKI